MKELHYDPHASGETQRQQDVWDSMLRPHYEKLLHRHARKLTEVILERRRLPEPFMWNYFYDDEGYRVWFNRKTHREISFQRSSAAVHYVAHEDPEVSIAPFERIPDETKWPRDLYAHLR